MKYKVLTKISQLYSRCIWDPKKPGAEDSSSDFFFLVLYFFDTYLVPASLEKNCPMIIKTTPEPVKRVESAGMGRSGLFTDIAKGNSSNSSLFVSIRLKKDSLVIITNTPEPAKVVIFSLLEKNGLAVEVAKGGSSNSSDFFDSSHSSYSSNSSGSSLEQNTWVFNSGLKPTLIVKPRISSQTIAFSRSLFF